MAGILHAVAGLSQPQALRVPPTLLTYFAPWELCLPRCCPRLAKHWAQSSTSQLSQMNICWSNVLLGAAASLSLCMSLVDSSWLWMHAH